MPAPAAAATPIAKAPRPAAAGPAPEAPRPMLAAERPGVLLSWADRVAKGLPVITAESMRNFSTLQSAVERHFHTVFRATPQYDQPEERVIVLELWLGRDEHCQALKDAWENAFTTTWSAIPSPRSPEDLWECICGMLATYQPKTHEIVAPYQGPISLEACKDFRAYLNRFIKAYQQWGEKMKQPMLRQSQVVLYAHLQQNLQVYEKVDDIIDANPGELAYTDPQLLTRLCERLTRHFGEPTSAAQAGPVEQKPTPPERPRPAPPVRPVVRSPAPSPAPEHIKKCLYHPEATNHSTDECKKVRHLVNRDRAAQAPAAAGQPRGGPQPSNGNTARTVYIPAAASAGTQQGARYGSHQGGNGGAYHSGTGGNGGRPNGAHNGSHGGQPNGTYHNGNSGQRSGYGGQQGQNRGNNFAPRSGN